jgi:hypothetical protein
MSDDRIDAGELARQRGKHVRKTHEDATLHEYDEAVNKTAKRYIAVLEVNSIPDWVVTAASRGEHAIVAYDVSFNNAKQHHGLRYTPFCARCGHDSVLEMETPRSQRESCKPGKHSDSEFFDIQDRVPVYNVFADALKVVHAEIVKKVGKRVAHVYVRTRYTSNRAFKIELLWGDAYPQFTRHSDKIKHVSSHTARTISGTVFCV